MNPNTEVGCLALQPANFYFTVCPIKDILSKLKANNLHGFVKVYLTGQGNTFLEEFYQQTSIKTPPNKLVLVAHGNKERYSFDSEHGYKDAEWWDDSPKIVIAHGCFSALILARDKWKMKFVDWVGSVDKVWHSLDETSAKIWPLFYEKLCQEFGQAVDARDMKDKFKELYFDSMYENNNHGNSSETYRTAIQRNLTVLTCRDEYSDRKTA